jgi:LysM repeat protein
MKGTTPLGFLGICVAFAVTAFLGGMAGSLLLGGDDGGATASAPVAQATAQGTPRPAGSGTPQAPGSVVAVAVSPTLPAGPVATNTPAATATPAAATYTVVSGDTLSGIAVKQNVPVDQRQAWITQVQSLNSMTATSVLQIGQMLKLPPASAGAATTPAPGGAATATRPAGTTPAAGGTTAPPSPTRAP